MTVGGGLEDYGIRDTDAASATDLHTAVILDFPVSARHVWANVNDPVATEHYGAEIHFAAIAISEVDRQLEEAPALSIQARFRIIAGLTSLLWMMIAAGAWTIFA